MRFLGMFCAFFVPVYFGGAWFAMYSGRAMDLYLDAELSIPLIPAMVWPYLSLYPLFLLPLVHLDANAMKRLSRQSVVTLVAAGLVFILLPGELGFPRGQAVQDGGAAIELIQAIDTPHNVVPSLHVAFACLILLACGSRSSPVLKTIYVAWMVLMSLSALLVHQHHVLDIVTGVGLALAVRRIMPLDAAAR